MLWYKLQEEVKAWTSAKTRTRVCVLPLLLFCCLMLCWLGVLSR